jgi:hypothetical protein
LAAWSERIWLITVLMDCAIRSCSVQSIRHHQHQRCATHGRQESCRPRQAECRGATLGCTPLGRTSQLGARSGRQTGHPVKDRLVESPAEPLGESKARKALGCTGAVSVRFIAEGVN